ncbi:MAG: MFS transporter [Patescibacteria group bacterium]
MHAHHMHHGRQNKELNEMYVSMTLRTFGLSLIAIFIPIYLYNLGFSLRTIFLYYIISSLFQFFGDYLAGKAIGRFGAKHVMSLSYPVLLIHLVMLVTLPIYHWSIWLLSIPAALSLSLFWPAYHDDFSKAKDKKATGKEVGKLFILMEGFGALGPIMGGIVAQVFGVQYGIIIAIVITMAAAIPLLGKKEITKRRPMAIERFSLRENYKDMIAYGGLSMEGMAIAIVWPLLLFFIIGNYARIGSIATISLLVTIALSIFIGKAVDKYKKENVLRVSSLVHFFTSTSRILVTSLNSAYIIGVASSLSHIILWVPFFSQYYLHADKNSRTEYVVEMEMSVDIFRMLGLTVLLICTYFFDIKTTLIVGIAVGAVGTLLSMLITSSKKKELSKEIRVHKEIAKASV